MQKKLKSKLLKLFKSNFLIRRIILLIFDNILLQFSFVFILSNLENKFIDEILISVMHSPNSFTGEDIVELHCHGGVIVVNKVMDTLISNNTEVRIANPGEFSQRAFLNGRIDLTQAESINQLINAKNLKSAEIAFNGVKGEIKKKIDVIKNDLIEQLS